MKKYGSMIIIGSMLCMSLLYGAAQNSDGLEKLIVPRLVLPKSTETPNFRQAWGKNPVTESSKSAYDSDDDLTLINDSALGAGANPTPAAAPAKKPQHQILMIGSATTVVHHKYGKRRKNPRKLSALPNDSSLLNDSSRNLLTIPIQKRFNDYARPRQKLAPLASKSSNKLA